MPYKLKTNKGGKFCVVNAETGKEVNCHADKAKALRQLRAISTNEKASLDVAGEYRFACHDEACDRAFLDFEQMIDHAEAVHTFDDIRRMVHEAVREEYGNKGTTGVAGTSKWVWIDDLADDWVVFMIEEGANSQLLKASYSITDGAVTLGEPSEVRRRTVYETLKKD